LLAFVAEPVEKPDARLLALDSHSVPTPVSQSVSLDHCRNSAERRAGALLKLLHVSSRLALFLFKLQKSLPLIVFGAMALPSRWEAPELAVRVGVAIAKILFVPESVDSRRT
jgi:hypothetical protein